MGVNFYNPERLLNMNDRNGEKPEILISISNRGAGKTYGFAKFLLQRFFENGEQFGLLCRWQRELGSVADGIFKAVLRNEYPEYSINEVVRQKGVYASLYLEHNVDDVKESVLCGYVLPVNGSDNLKKVSSTFSEIKRMFMDEFQADSYCPDEVEKFVNIHFTVARGDENGVRFVPVILASNSLSIINPYFISLGLSNKIQSNTRFYRGIGLVLERFVNEDVAKKQKESPFNQAFAYSKQVQSNIDNSWLNDSMACVAKPSAEWGKSYYYCTLCDGDKKYGVRYYYINQLFYVSRSIDAQCKSVFNISVEGIEDISFIKTSSHFDKMRRAYSMGAMRFSDLSVKTAIASIIM